MAEYGDPDKPEEWAYIQTFSPYQNVKAGAKYPPVLFMTSTRDDRVHPGGVDERDLAPGRGQVLRRALQLHRALRDQVDQSPAAAKIALLTPTLSVVPA